MDNMESRAFVIKSESNPRIRIEAVPGHFVTSHSHINYCLNITQVKHEHAMARDAAAQLAAPYLQFEIIDTIVCMEGSEILGAFLARELTKSGMRSINQGSSLFVISPEYDANGQMFFRENLQPMVADKSVLLLISTVSTGKTIRRALDCIRYFGGRTCGIAAVFSAIPMVEDLEIQSLFSTKDLPDYASFSTGDCPDCKAHRPIDAMVNSFGYSKL